MSRVPMIVLAGCVWAVAGCGGAGRDPQDTAAGSAQARGVTGPKASRGALGDPERVVSRSARLGANRPEFVLASIPKVGQVLVKCDGQKGPRVAFRADHLLATADVVVDIAGGQPVATTLQPGQRYQPAPAAAVVRQTWQIAPFAAANVRVTVLQVAARQLDEAGGGWACAASVRGAVSSSQGATRLG